jgi:hypothetical protein
MFNMGVRLAHDARDAISNMGSVVKDRSNDGNLHFVISEVHWLLVEIRDEVINPFPQKICLIIHLIHFLCINIFLIKRTIAMTDRFSNRNS